MDGSQKRRVIGGVKPGEKRWNRVWITRGGATLEGREVCVLLRQDGCRKEQGIVWVG